MFGVISDIFRPSVSQMVQNYKSVCTNQSTKNQQNQQKINKKILQKACLPTNKPNMLNVWKIFQ